MGDKATETGNGSPQPANSRPRTRASRQETTERILDAAEELFASRNPKDVTVRDVAEQAGVTHALVHQYVGSKEDLFNAVVQRAAPDRQALIREIGDFRKVVDALLPDVLERKLNSHMMLRSAMDGAEYTSLQERIDTGELLIESAKAAVDAGHTRRPAPGPMDPRVVVASLVAISYGWVGLGDWLLQVCDLQDEDPEELFQQLREVVDVVADLILPPPPGASSTS